MSTTYDVRIWKTKVYKGKTVSTYYVRWCVAGHEFKEPFRNSAQADSFRADIVAAARKGEAFDSTDGRPISAHRLSVGMSWFEFACGYVDSKWSRSAATTRRTVAEALTAITMSLFSARVRPYSDRALRSALTRFAFNAKRRDADKPRDIEAALKWAATHTVQVSALSDPAVLRRVLDGITTRIDGAPRAASVVTRWRKVLSNVLERAVEAKLLAQNPLPTLRWTVPKSSNAIDRRRVVNPVQARTLLGAVRDQGTFGPRIVALFGCLYFAALRPEEAAALEKHNLSLPLDGWGELHLGRATPFAGKEWTDNQTDRDERGLKQRAINETRIVPCPPELTAMLHEHLRCFGTAPDGSLFAGDRRRDYLPRRTVGRVWTRARQAAFTPDLARTPLAATPYDLRHAAVSTWLNAGIPATTVAEWAGHSVDVLLSIYAKCLDGEAALHRARIDDALGRRTRDGS